MTRTAVDVHSIYIILLQCLLEEIKIQYSQNNISEHFQATFILIHLILSHFELSSK